jgi:hypothetical protein
MQCHHMPRMIQCRNQVDLQRTHFVVARQPHSPTRGISGKTFLAMQCDSTLSIFYCCSKLKFHLKNLVGLAIYGEK